MVYSGYTAGTMFNGKGGGSNYLCMTDEPIWGKHDTGTQEGALLYGTGYEYGARSELPMFNRNLDEYNTPCAVCQTRRSINIMIPGRNKCTDGWTLEYHGYLFAGRSTHTGSSQFICVDVEPGIVGLSKRKSDQSLLYIAEVRCGTLPCPPYNDGWEPTCVVCSK